MVPIYNKFLLMLQLVEIQNAFYTFRKTLEERDKVYDQIAEYLQLKTVIEKIKVNIIELLGHCKGGTS